MADVYNLTQSGYDELKLEMDKLIEDRPAVAQRIKIARDFGDLRENAEYGAAKEEQSKNESRIKEIENILENSKIIEKSGSSDQVSLGSVVDLVDEKGKPAKFQVVGSVQANPLEGLVSDESPIGKALLAKKLGESVEVALPAKTIVYKIKKIS